MVRPHLPAPLELDRHGEQEQQGKIEYDYVCCKEGNDSVIVKLSPSISVIWRVLLPARSKRDLLTGPYRRSLATAKSSRMRKVMTEKIV